MGEIIRVKVDKKVEKNFKLDYFPLKMIIYIEKLRRR